MRDHGGYTGRTDPRHGRSGWLRHCLVALLLLLGASWPAMAEGLRQTGVPAEATGANGVVAREQALANARRIAWGRLVAEGGGSPIALSDSQIEAMVTSIVIEEERPAPTRYTGRITVNFSPGRVRGVLGSRAPAGGGGGGGGGGVEPAVGGVGTIAATAPTGPAPASATIEAVAGYRSMAEWLELRRRLTGATPVASVQIQGIAIDSARLRLGLRGAPDAVAAELAGLGVALIPDERPPQGFPGTGLPGTSGAPGGWRVGLAGGR